MHAARTRRWFFFALPAAAGLAGLPEGAGNVAAFCGSFLSLLSEY